MTHIQNQWISVKDRLPEYFTMAIVWNTRKQEGFEVEIQVFINKFTHGVTHWQPLPAAPDGINNDQENQTETVS